MTPPSRLAGSRRIRDIDDGQTEPRLGRTAGRRWTGWILPAIYFVALAFAGIGIGHYGAKYYRMKTSKCKPCELAAASTPKPVAPGEGISNP
jgi:hypothetical protein